MSSDANASTALSTQSSLIAIYNVLLQQFFAVQRRLDIQQHGVAIEKRSNQRLGIVKRKQPTFVQ